MGAEHGKREGAVFELGEQWGGETGGFAAEDEVAALAVAGVVVGAILFEA